MADVDVKTLEKQADLLSKGKINIKDYNKSLRDFVKTNQASSKSLKETKKALDEINPAFKEFQKMAKEFTASKISKELSEFPSYIKKVDELANSFNEYSEAMGKTSKVIKNLGMSYSKEGRKIQAQSEKVKESFFKIIDTSNKFMGITKDLSQVTKSVTDVQEALKSPIDKAGAEKTIDRLNKDLIDLKSNIKPEAFEKLSSILQKIPKDSKKGIAIYVTDYKKELEKLSDEDFSPSLIDVEGSIKNVNDFKNKVKKSLDNIPQFELSGKGLTGLEDIQNLIDNIKKSEVPLDESMQRSIDIVEKAMKDPAKYINLINQEVHKLGSSFEGVFKRYQEKSIASLEIIQKQAKEKLESLKDPINLSFNIGQAEAEIKDFIDSYDKTSIDLRIGNVELPESLVNIKELTSFKDSLKEKNAEYLDITIQINKLDESDIALKKELLKQQQQIRKEIEGSYKHIKNTLDTSRENLKIGEDVAKTGWGEEKAKVLSTRLTTASISLKKLGAEVPIIGGLFDKLGGSVGSLSKVMSKMAIPMALMGAAVSLGKLILDLESKMAGMYKGISNAGVLYNTTAKDTVKVLEDTFSEATNIAGLKNAWLNSSELALTRDEIMGVTKAFWDAGVPLDKLKKQMEGVTKYSQGMKKPLVGLATLTDTFAMDLNVTREEMSGTIGQLITDYGATLGSVQKNFVDIANAAKDSGMTTNRFLATVQTATAGMALYEDQIKSAAIAISKLGKDGQLTTKDVEKLAKDIPSFFKDMDASMAGLALMSKNKEAFKTVTQKVEQEITVLEDKKSAGKATKQDEQQLQLLKELRTAFEKGDVKTISSLASEALGMEEQSMLMGGILKEMVKASTHDGKFDKFEFKKFAQSMKIGDGIVDAVVKTNGSVTDALTNIENLSLSTNETFKGKFDKNLEAQKKTEEKRNKALAAVKDSATNLATQQIRWLEIIAGLLAISSALDGGKTLIGVFKNTAWGLKIAKQTMEYGKYALKPLSYLGTVLEWIASKFGLMGTAVAAAAAITLYSPDVGQGAGDVPTDTMQARDLLEGRKKSETGTEFWKNLSEEQKKSVLDFSKTDKAIADKLKKWGISQNVPIGEVPPVVSPIVTTEPKTAALSGATLEPQLVAGGDLNKGITPDITKFQNLLQNKQQANQSTVNININGGDEARVTKIVRDEVYNATGKRAP